LAQKLNVDQATLSRWERDQTLPRHEHQIRLADLLGGDRTDYGQPLDHHGGE
jgi:transcriptional regulator with XRE-family HTH domain